MILQKNHFNDYVIGWPFWKVCGSNRYRRCGISTAEIDSPETSVGWSYQNHPSWERVSTTINSITWTRIFQYCSICYYLGKKVVYIGVQNLCNWSCSSFAVGSKSSNVPNRKSNDSCLSHRISIDSRWSVFSRSSEMKPTLEKRSTADWLTWDQRYWCHPHNIVWQWDYFTDSFVYLLFFQKNSWKDCKLKMQPSGVVESEWKPNAKLWSVITKNSGQPYQICR